MNILTYDDIKLTKEIYGLKVSLLEQLLPQLIKKYPTFDNRTQNHASLAIRNQLGYLLWATDNVLEHKVILDLGCGSTNPYIEGNFFLKDSMYEPWICRALQQLGATPSALILAP